MHGGEKHEADISFALVFFAKTLFPLIFAEETHMQSLNVDICLGAV